MKLKLYLSLIIMLLAIACTQTDDPENDPQTPPDPEDVIPNNPILKLNQEGFLYLADPAAEVFNGKAYIYCSHDQDDATSYSSMQDYALLSSDDMINWTNHGVILYPREYSWTSASSGDSQMNAPDAVYQPKDGYYYFYFPYDKTYVGVVRSKNPEGPWEEVYQGYITAIFDPTVIIDDDGQAYIYGNDLKVGIGDSGTHMFGAKLKDNMYELDGDWQRISKETVAEAVHVFKREGLYHFTARVSSYTEYWTSDSPLPIYDPETDTGGATHHGIITDNPPDAPAHNSFIEFNGQWYIFYQRGDVNDGSSFKRSSCYDKVYFDQDGIMEYVTYTLGDQYDDIEPEDEMTGTNYYPDIDLRTYSIDTLYLMATDENGANFPEGTTWYIEDNAYEKVEYNVGNDKIDEIFIAASKVYQNGEITIDFSYSTFTTLDAGFCPDGFTGTKAGYSDDYKCLGAITGLNQITSILAWSIRNCEYLKIIEGLDNFSGIPGNYSFFDLPALESISLPEVTSINTKIAFYNCTGLKTINTPKLETCANTHFQNTAPETWYLTTDTDISSSFALPDNFTSTGCDLHLSSTNYANVTNTYDWGGKTWRSITEVK